MEGTADLEVEEALLHGKNLSSDEVMNLRECLNRMKVKDIKSLAKNLSVHVTTATRKTELIDRLMAMAPIGAIQKQHSGEEEAFSISYLTPEVKEVLRSLPSFSNVTNWSKKLDGVLVDYTFMNLLMYLVYGRDKSFDMQLLNAFKSLKAFKFFYDGFVKNVWVHECPSTNQLDLRVLYFRAFWCDFVVYSNDSVIVDRIIADADYWNHLSERLEQLYVTHVIPEILSGKILMEEFELST